MSLRSRSLSDGPLALPDPDDPSSAGATVRGVGSLSTIPIGVHALGALPRATASATPDTGGPLVGEAVVASAAARINRVTATAVGEAEVFNPRALVNRARVTAVGEALVSSAPRVDLAPARQRKIEMPPLDRRIIDGPNAPSNPAIGEGFVGRFTDDGLRKRPALVRERKPSVQLIGEAEIASAKALAVGVSPKTNRAKALAVGEAVVVLAAPGKGARAHRASAVAIGEAVVVAPQPVRPCDRTVTLLPANRTRLEEGLDRTADARLRCLFDRSGTAMNIVDRVA